MRRELTDAFLRTLQPPKSGRLELQDDRVAGLVLRMTASGTATWSVRTRTKDNKQTRPKLGTWPAMGLAAARKAAMAALSGIQTGADPVEEKRKAREARRLRLAEATVAERLAEWRAIRETSKERRWSDRHTAEVKRVCERYIGPKLGKRPLTFHRRHRRTPSPFRWYGIHSRQP